MWDKFRNVNRNYKLRTIPPLEREGNIITSPDKITDHYANISKDPHKKSKPRKNGRGRKKRSYHIITIHRQGTESSHKTTNEYSTWKGYYSSPDDKKNYHQRH